MSHFTGTVGPRLVALAAALAGLAAGAVGVMQACSLPEGNGNVTGVLDVPTCWSGKFDLGPDFYAGVPYGSTLQLRIQKGGDYETFSDGVSILIDDVNQIRPSDNPSTPFAGLYNVPLAVSLPPAVVPPGVPVRAVATPAQVHFALFLQQSCRTQNVALYAVDEVLLNADGTCGSEEAEPAPLPCAALVPADEAGTAQITVDGGATVPAGRSAIVFQSLFDGNPDEEIAARRLNQGSFHVYLADPREIAPGGLGPPPKCRGELCGSFSFYFQRGQPAQPFP